MHEAEPNDATPFPPERKSLAALRDAAAGCRGCHLWRHAAQTAFGEGMKKSRAEIYVTNVVKHFAFEERGKRRMHRTPKRFEIEACRPWLEEELRQVRPEALVLLGATAAKALLGASFRITRERGRPLASDLAPLVLATAHPSSILRQRTDEDRHEERRLFTEDLRVVAEAL